MAQVRMSLHMLPNVTFSVCVSPTLSDSCIIVSDSPEYFSVAVGEDPRVLLGTISPVFSSK